MISFRLLSEDQMQPLGKTLRRLLREHSERGLLVTVDAYKPPASNKQTTKLVLMLNELAELSGNDAEAMRAWFRHAHGPKRSKRLKRTEIVEPKKFTEYSKAEASEAIERVYQLAAEAGYTLQEGG